MLLTHNDESTIRNIIDTRLCSLRGVAILEIKIKRLSDCIKCGVLLDVDDLRLNVCSIFELPLVFDKSALLNEIDEIAEGVQTARLDTLATRVRPSPLSKQLPGTGLRGRWAGARMI